MKNLTHEELIAAPPKIRSIYFLAITKTPMGSGLIESAIKEHPEYFPDEVEHRKKWSLIPQSVHDDYWKEWRALEEKVYADIPDFGGISNAMKHPEKFAEWSSARDAASEKARPLFKALHDKHYSKYGIEWNGRVF